MNPVVQLPHALGFRRPAAKGVVKFCDLPGAVVEKRLGSAQFGGRGLELTKVPAVVELAYLHPKRIDLFQHRILRRFKPRDRDLVFDISAPDQRADGEEEREFEMKVPPHNGPLQIPLASFASGPR